MKIYDVSGRLVADIINDFQQAGSYNVNFNGANLASGVMYTVIEMTNSNGEVFKDVRKMILIK
jgi:hypothetical protein